MILNIYVGRYIFIRMNNYLDVDIKSVGCYGMYFFKKIF